MIAELGFGPAALDASGRRVRATRFARTSNVALTTACVVANGMRETLRALFGEAVVVELGEIAAVEQAVWAALARDAELLVVSGNAADAAIVLDPRDARRLVLRAFGEDATRDDTQHSALERRAYERILTALAGALDPLCGERRGPPRAAHASDDTWTSYFDVRIRAPIEARIGVAVARENVARPPALARPLAALDAVPLVLTARIALAPLTLAGLAALRVGDFVPVDTEAGFAASLNLDGRCAARGVCGVAHGRLSVRITSLPGDAP